MGLFDDISDAVNQAAPALPAIASIVQNPSNIIDVGVKLATSNAVIGAARNMMPPQMQSAFDLANGVMAHNHAPDDLAKIAATLKFMPGFPPVAIQGLLTAAALQHGTVKAPSPPSTIPPSAKAAFYITHGMTALPPKLPAPAPAFKASMMKVIVANPEARVGAVVAVKQIANQRKSLWQRIKDFFHHTPTTNK